ncbi:MAG: efflux RND transporter periplasmic adaptor subunit [Methylobacteriaceae bacterium]|nr:efflux RND transporter periplasmic adaptor subunit [Methylobacteriaceae bacterium]MBV9704910.1 efflux RND transporter periplasmic adaptor subunit [Methylobacteriaceae bacterium]
MSRSQSRIAAVASVAATMALAGCDQAQKAAEAKPERPVLVERVHYEDRAPARTLVGTVRPRFESDLGFRVPGKVARRLVEVGQMVKSGDALATLDDTDLQLQRDEADAELKAAITSLAQAEADLKRATELRKNGWTTDQTLEKQNVAVEEARARRDKAGRALTLAVNASDYATLRADADGVVTATDVEAGQVVAAGQTAIVVARLAEKEAAIAVPEALVARVRTGIASVSLWSRPDKVYNARLRELSPSADPATRTYAARFTILASDDEVRLGMTATLTLADADNERIARLPLSALFNQTKGPSVWVVDAASGALTLKPVTIAGYDARDVVISGGIEEGERVVTLGVQKLDAGQKVRTVQTLGL